jgi:putative ABC transport system substrate-binding protein
MKQRDFMVAVAGGLAAWPLRATLAETPGRVWRPGFLAQGYENFHGALFEALRPLSYIEGKNLVVERRYAKAVPTAFPNLPSS